MYEEYMQNLLGGNIYNDPHTYDSDMINMNCHNNIDNYVPNNYWQNMPYNNDFSPYYSVSETTFPHNYSRNILSQTINLEDLYPEIYKIVYPMIKKACTKITKPIDEDLIDEITKEIYNSIETDNIINVNINVDNDNNINKVSNKTSTKPSENRSSDNRQIMNPLMNDLIRILLLRELFGRTENRPPRPPFPGPRPPMPPRPPFPGSRPPMPRF